MDAPNEAEIAVAFQQGSIELPALPRGENEDDTKFTGYLSDNYADCVATNLRWCDGESDLIAINSRTECVIEFEIKITKSDLLSECGIAKAARKSSKGSDSDNLKPKFRKHRRYHNLSGKNPPHFFSFLIPENLAKDALRERPPYAGVLIYRKSRSQNLDLEFEWLAQPTALFTGKLTLPFLKYLAIHQYRQSRSLFCEKAVIRRGWANSRIDGLTQLANAVRGAESKLAAFNHPSENIRKAFYERAASGLVKRDKEQLQRIYEKLYK